MKDEVFKEKIKKQFEFDESVASVFDDMLSRSVPFYEEMLHLTTSFGLKYLEDGDRVYDLGCSTASTLIYLAKHSKKRLSLIGIDNSSAMLQRANYKAKAFGIDIDFLENYANAISPSGMEEEAQTIWADKMSEYSDNMISDNFGSVCSIINPGKDFRVMIEAHADEISWTVNVITNNGFIYLKKNGGADELIPPSKRVWIMTKDGGKVPAVFGWPATHIRDKKIGPDAKSVYLDLGARTKAEVLKMGVSCGDPVIFQEGFVNMGQYVCGRGLDNKVGGYILQQVARKLKENNIVLPYSLYIVNSVQEEVGQRGLYMISKEIKPHIGLVTDVCHDTNTPMINKTDYGDIDSSGGPVISYAPSVNKELNDFICNVGKNNKIPIQKKVSSIRTGTDLEAVAYSGKGIPASLISVPMRYMHTTVEMVSKLKFKEVKPLIDKKKAINPKITSEDIPPMVTTKRKIWSDNRGFVVISRGAGTAAD
jgi:putative aminopeptidase FrvX